MKRESSLEEVQADHTHAERTLHEALAEWRMNGEWFDLPPGKVEWVCSHTWVADLGMQAVVISGEKIVV